MNLLDQMKGALFDETPQEKAVRENAEAQANKRTASTAPIQSPSGWTPPPSVSGPAPSWTPMSSNSPAIDPDVLKTVQSQVYANVNGHPSRYLVFMEMFVALGRPSDLNSVVNAMKVSDHTLTTQSLLDDLVAHLALLDQCRQKATSDLDNAEKATLGTLDGKITDLQTANTTAVSEITRHQTETAERNTQIATLQQDRANADAKINQTRQQISAAEDQTQSELQNMQQRLTAIGG